MDQPHKSTKGHFPVWLNFLLCSLCFWMYRGKNRSTKSLFISMWSPGWQLSVYHFSSMFLFISTALIVLLFTCINCTVEYILQWSFAVLFSTWQHESGAFSLVRVYCIIWKSMSSHKCASNMLNTLLAINIVYLLELNGIFLVNTIYQHHNKIYWFVFDCLMIKLSITF